MKTSIRRTVAAVVLAGAATCAVSVPALAATPPAGAPGSGGDVTIVDEPDTSGLNNTWTFAPLGVPVFGLIQSLAQAPGKLV